MEKIKVKFIKHSCYTLTTKNYYLVFDYIGGKLEIPKDKKVFFFVSHRHEDHFSSKIFDYPADAYIISDDVSVKANDKIKLIGPDQELKIDDLKIISHGSTDEGVSFYVEADDFGAIHCGDLNYWMWPHYTKKDIEEMDAWFKSEIDKFKDLKTDIVMMPVDPRLNEYYDLTADYILKTIDAKHFFPMHMWEDFDISKRLKDKYQASYPDKILYIISGNGDEFEIEK